MIVTQWSMHAERKGFWRPVDTNPLIPVHRVSTKNFPASGIRGVYSKFVKHKLTEEYILLRIASQARQQNNYED
jgi:hypothetical protein